MPMILQPIPNANIRGGVAASELTGQPSYKRHSSHAQPRATRVGRLTVRLHRHHCLQRSRHRRRHLLPRSHGQVSTRVSVQPNVPPWLHPAHRTRVVTGVSQLLTANEQDLGVAGARHVEGVYRLVHRPIGIVRVHKAEDVPSDPVNRSGALGLGRRADAAPTATSVRRLVRSARLVGWLGCGVTTGDGRVW